MFRNKKVTKLYLRISQLDPLYLYTPHTFLNNIGITLFIPLLTLFSLRDNK